jgi:hypothetical protein
MPLHDHFTGPLSVTRPWEGFHSAWATMIALEVSYAAACGLLRIP